MQLVGPGHSQHYKLLGLQGPSYEEEIMSMFIGSNVCCMIQESLLVTDHSLIEKKTRTCTTTSSHFMDAVFVSVNNQ